MAKALPVGALINAATIVPVSITTAPPWKKIPAAAIRRNRRPGSAAIIRSSPAGMQIANGGDGHEAGDLHHEDHGERPLLAHAEQAQREDRANDESAGEPRKMGEDHDKAQKNDEKEIIERSQ